MPITTRVTTADLAREVARKVDLSPEKAQHLLEEIFASLREHLQAGQVIQVGDLFTLAVSGGAELREDDSGGFSAYAPRRKGLAVKPLGTLKDDLAKALNAAIYYVSRTKGHFIELLSDHFGRRGWAFVHVRNGMEVLSRLENQPPAALLFESHAEGWQELVRELKCTPRTNWVPIVGIFPEETDPTPLARLTVQPDEIVREPFDFGEFIQTAALELAARATSPQHDTVELEVLLPGSQRELREVRDVVEEILFRCALPETFGRDAGSALAEALDNAVRHGHQFVECCTLSVRLVLDPRRLVLVVRDSGKGFDHVGIMAAARERQPSPDGALARAAAALQTRRGGPREGGIARMLRLVDRVEHNRAGNEVVLTKFLPRDS